MNNMNNVNKVGSVKMVNGFTFTLLDRSDKMRYIVEVTAEGTDLNELVIVAHNTWKSGKFVKVTKEMIKKLNEQNK